MKNIRGIDIGFAEAFKNSVLYKLYKEHKNELFLGVRNNYLNLYYNCDCIAKIKYRNQSIICELDKYYLDGNHHKNFKEKRYKTEPYEIYNNYDILKKHSDDKTTNEKKAQSKLVILNNGNKSSNWFCIDIEYEKSGFRGRFDIIAVSKEKPHKAALIELKYGRNAIGGNSGIYEHIKNFLEFCKEGYFARQTKQEIVSIIKSLHNLGIKIPFEIPETSSICPVPDFYFITLDNNPEKEGAGTPKQTMAAYLFEDKRWGCKELSNKNNVQKDFKIDVTKKNNKFYAKFLFSEKNLENRITINDIINYKYYDREPKK
jgi:hypothetical protein